MKKSFNILICVTGSVAAIKLTNILQGFQTNSLFDVVIKVVRTENAKHFLPSEEVLLNAGAEAILSDENEWISWSRRGDPVLHIELRKWADLAVIAPLDANTLAKIASGICDNLLTCVLRAWDFSKPVYFAPAMNTFMWKHPITSQHVELLKAWGFIEIPVIEKVLICKDTGLGAMAEPETIVQTIISMLQLLSEKSYNRD